MNDLEIIQNNWNDILNKIKSDYNLLTITFDTWLNPLRLYDFINGELLILVPEEGYKKYLYKKFSLPIKQIVEEKTKIIVAVHFLIKSEANEYIKTLLEQQNPANSYPTINMAIRTEEDIFQVYDADNKAVKGVFLSYKNALEYKQMLTKKYERNFTISMKKVNHNECCTMFQILHQI